MQSTVQSESKGRQKIRRRIVMWLLVSGIVVITLLTWLTPVFISSGNFRRMILAKINHSVAGHTDCTSLSMSWLKGVQVADFRFKDNAGQVSVQVKQLTTKPHYGSFLTGNLSFGETTIEEPEVRVTLAGMQMSHMPQQKTSRDKKAHVWDLPVKHMDLIVKDGRLRVTDRKANTAELSRINSKVSLRPPGQQMSFALTTAVSGKDKESKMSVDGHMTVDPATAKTGWQLKGMTGDVTIQVKALDLESLEPFIALTGMDIQAQGMVSADLRSRITDGRLDDLAVTVTGRNMDVTVLQPKGDRLQTVALDTVHMNVDKLNISAPFAQINCAGNMESIDYNADINVATLKSELGPFVDIGPYNMAATFLSKGRVSVKENAIITSGASQVRDLRFGGPNEVTASLPVAEVVHAFTFDRQNRIIHIDSVKADTSCGLVTIEQATAPLKRAAVKPMNLIVDASNVDLARLQPFAVLFASFPKETQLAGTLESSISIHSEKDLYRITTDSTRIANFQFLSPGKNAFKQQDVLLIADVELNPVEQVFSIKKLQVLSDQIKADFAPVRLTTETGQTHLQGQARLEYDWLAVTQVASRFLPNGLELQGQGTVSLDFSSQYPRAETDKLLANLNTNACKLGFDRAHYMGLDFGPTDVTLQVEKGVLTIAPFSSTVNGGQLDFSAHVDFGQTPRLLTITQPIAIKGVPINDAMSQELLVYVNPIFAGAVNVSGVASFGAAQLALPLAGAGTSDLQVTGTIAIDNVRLRPAGLLAQIISLVGGQDPSATLTIHPSHFVLQDGFVRYDDMQVDIDNKPVNFKGVIGLDKSLDMTVTLPYTAAGKTITFDKQTLGKRIAMSLKGSIYQPKLDINRLLEDQLNDILLKGLDKLLK